MKIAVVLALCCVLLTHCLATPLGAEEILSKRVILAAIKDGATYAAEILLDEEGKSRCDYQILEGKWTNYEPAWHTGQIIYALTRAYEITGNRSYLDAARKAGDWWVSLEIKDHPKLTGMIRAIHGAGIDYIVFATVSDGTAGLFRLHRLTKEDKYAAVPTRAGQWMHEHMWHEQQRVYYDCVDPKTGEVMKKWSPFWEEKQEQTLFDVARPNNEGSLFKDMYEYTSNESYKQHFLQLCDSLVEKQGPEGLWMDFTPNDKVEGYFHPRFPLWYAESLLDGYEMTQDERYLEAALKTARVYTRFQKKDGAFYYRNYLDGSADRRSISGSTTSFAGIVWLRLIQHGVGDEFKQNVDRSLRWVLANRFAKDHPDRNLAGAFLELRSKSKRGTVTISNRDLATPFGIRFLADYYQSLD
jgi:uncharacterized protein YyaL (SSP411 family)